MLKVSLALRDQCGPLFPCPPLLHFRDGRGWRSMQWLCFYMMAISTVLVLVANPLGSSGWCITIFFHVKSRWKQGLRLLHSAKVLVWVEKLGKKILSWTGREWACREFLHALSHLWVVYSIALFLSRTALHTVFNMAHGESQLVKVLTTMKIVFLG